jgi:hypothetical protein
MCVCVWCVFSYFFNRILVRCPCVATAYKIFHKILVHKNYIKTNTTYIINLNIHKLFSNCQYRTKLIQIKLYCNANIRKRVHLDVISVLHYGNNITLSYVLHMYIDFCILIFSSPCWLQQARKFQVLHHAFIFCLHAWILYWLQQASRILQQASYAPFNFLC